MESLIATAIIAITATSAYYAFLKMNDFAVASRCDTAAKIALERAVNLAMTSDWRASTPPVLDPAPDFKPFDLNTGADSDGSVSLFMDPASHGVIVGNIYRQVTPYPVPADKLMGDICRVTFRLNFKLHKRADEPVSSMYAYTVRARDK